MLDTIRYYLNTVIRDEILNNMSNIDKCHTTTKYIEPVNVCTTLMSHIMKVFFLQKLKLLRNVKHTCIAHMQFSIDAAGT